MNQLGFPLLSLLLWTPALGALLLLAVPASRAAAHRQIGLAVSGLALALAVAVVVLAGPAGGAQLAEQFAWLPTFGAAYQLGVDGVSLWLVLLTALLAPFAVGATWSRFVERPRGMVALLLLAETAFLGVFLAQDMLLFYVFYELALLPMVFLVGMWGSGARSAAALKLFLFTFAGSVLMLVGIIALYVLHRAQTGVATFDIAQITASLRSGLFVLPLGTERLLFGAFFAAFAVKLALWPLHTWVPDAYGAAPIPAAIMLAGAMSKFGTYGLIRFNLNLFPQAAEWAAPAVGILAVIGIIYAAIVAYAQSDTQRVVAYSSVSHMNFIALGIFALNPLGLNGAVFQMVAHGLTTAFLLLLVGVLLERRGTRELAAFSGLWKSMPAYGGLALLALLASAGLPGLISFVGEFTIMQGVFTSTVLGYPFAAGAAVGVILAAVYTLRWFQIGFMGESDGTASADLAPHERLALGALALAVIVGGLYPNLILGFLSSTGL